MDAQEITELVRRASEGDQAAWNAIVENYANVVWAQVRRYRLDAAQAADVVQTTWLRLVEHLDDIRDPAQLAGWLRTTAARACFKSTRDSRRESVVDFHDEYSVASLSSATVSSDVSDASDGPEAWTLKHEHERLVRMAVERLSERDRTLLDLLTSADAPSYAQISRQLHMPIGSIGPTRARIMARLRAALADAALYDYSLT